MLLPLDVLPVRKIRTSHSPLLVEHTAKPWILVRPWWYCDPGLPGPLRSLISTRIAGGLPRGLCRDPGQVILLQDLGCCALFAAPFVLLGQLSLALITATAFGGEKLVYCCGYRQSLLKLEHRSVSPTSYPGYCCGPRQAAPARRAVTHRRAEPTGNFGPKKASSPQGTFALCSWSCNVLPPSPTASSSPTGT